ncbi:type VII secretion protein EccB [Mycobacterium shinjukuense]|uniref:Type VII secretion protein EccB n=1 Tax=Mycobacterium shinjukuense TaxID=398694 RepID=A0A7I7MRD1_9MYCO|nr:type VII secretion protein EccB [Mycobacterium shinjukuense]MCV6987324.1 type VII secretion protein EccB [Mycobacterium shinjukuense]ORB72017.1 type VII secretion protein EccB [Mycobacterium shinjukuense]BBX74771.1 type VII secretion protein EccB [Mycobacterium shinjukuense]
MPGSATTWLHVSGHRVLLRRIECALLRGDIRMLDEPRRARAAALAVGCVVAVIALAGCAVVALLRPAAELAEARIVMGRQTGALYVRVGDTWHPVLNLASARLIAATDANPTPVPESALTRTKRGPLLGIPGAPQLLTRPLAGGESSWTMCDTDATTTVLVGPVNSTLVRRLAADQAILVATGSDAPAYLLYRGRRAAVDVAEAAVLRALRLDGRVRHVVSPSLLTAVPEAPPITVPRIRGVGGPAAALPGFRVGSVLRVTRAQGDEYYVVLADGVQRIGQVAADLLRFSDSQGSATAIAVAPDVIRAAPLVNTLPVASFPDFPDRASPPSDGGDGTLCVSWAPGPAGGADVEFLVGSRPPVPAGHTAVTLSQADGHGPALDAVYLPPGRSAYVAARGLSGDPTVVTRVGTRYLVTDTGVRFAVHDDDAAHDLGLPAGPPPAPWPVLATLPAGPELSRQQASVARDTVVTGPP